MNRINYQKKMEEVLAELQKTGEVPRLLLHSCCAPCSSRCLEVLSEHFLITDYYYNPNITEEEEYRKRAEELQRLIGAMPLPHAVTYAEGPFEPEAFFRAAEGLEEEPEGGRRCEACFRLRLFEAARFAAEAGHTVLSPSPVLVGLETAEDWPRSLQGLSLRNVTLTLSRGKKVLYTELGEMLFTHFGISGPLALEASCHLPEDLSDVSLSIDLKPGLTPEQLDARLLRDFAASGKKQLQTELTSLLPARLAELFPRLCGLPDSLRCSQITGEQRRRLCETLKALLLTISSPRQIAEAIVTRGGVSVKEVDPAAMRSKLLPNLYFAGELLDVDAHTGGYNLQIAWSTGALSGKSAADCLIHPSL